MKSFPSPFVNRRFLRSFFGLLLGAVALGLSQPDLHAQIYISPDNTLTGNTFFIGDVEATGSAYFDNGVEMVGGLTVGDSAYVNDVYAWNVYADSLYYNYTANEFTVTGNLEVTSGFTTGLTVNRGAANSWVHVGLDFGDLTYASADTPAFNISEAESGGYLYPTIYFTGYDANTTWTWQQNGLAGMANASLLTTQMELSNAGNLTLTSPASGDSILFNPGGGTIGLDNANGTLTIADTNANTITFDTGNQSITFYNGTTHDTASITPQSSALTFSTTSSGQAYGAGANATGNYSFALGNDTLASGDGSFAIGNHLTAAYFDSTVLGQWNAAISGSGSGDTTWSATDPLFVIGNGLDSGNRSNALVILKNGDTVLNGNLTVNGSASFNGAVNTLNGTVNFTGNVSLPPQGDILMGDFGN